MQAIQGLFFRDFQTAHIPEILEEIYLKKIYEKFLVGKKELIIVDVGANIGLTSFYFKDYAKRVYALEPAKEHVQTLEQMVAFNKITNVTICPYGLSNHSGKETFYINEGNTTANSLSLKTDKTETITVKSLGDFMAKEKLTHIDLMKLDPEGEEGKIITSTDFKTFAPEIVVGEWHSWSNMEKGQFATTFIDLGYDFHWLHTTQAACYYAIKL